MIRKFKSVFPLIFTLLFFQHCNQAGKDEDQSTIQAPLFELVQPEKSNITFRNNIVEGLNTNVLMYEYFYNGGGVAAGDLNNDGLEDLYFTSNMEQNVLYLNMGNLEFREVASIAGVTGRPGPWKTGISMADVNGDGLLDLYLCYSGKLGPQKLINQLFINQGPDASGIPRFAEQTAQYGLAFPTNSTHAVFFDYDHDGDLDLFILNHHPDSLPKLNEEDTEEILKIDDQVHGVRLMRNDNGKFTDVTIRAGFISSPITYGLGAGVADINLDGWTDIYICNDFSLPDYLYINNGDGTFTDRLQEMLGHTSYASMGNNVADINNDGFPDIFSLDMLPEDNRRQKLLLAPNDYDFFDLNLRLGFYYQYLRSMLHLNNGNGTFSEIGQIAGIEATDWSWTPQFADFDNDGWKDLLITNGYLRDYTNMDFLRNMDLFIQQNRKVKRTDVLHLVEQMPETELYNYIYRNNGNSTFTHVNRIWGLDEGSYSNGAVYTDLDNDGDLEIVTNNINKQAFIYRNRSESVYGHNYLKIRLNGGGKNKSGHGARVYVHTEGKSQMLEQQPARGYQSSVSPILHFGLGKIQKIDSVNVLWLGGNSETKVGIMPNQVLVFNEAEAVNRHVPMPHPPSIFREVQPPVQFRHAKVEFNDFKRQPLMVNAKSFEGPCLVKADVNGDGNEDIFIGGGAGQPGKLFLRSETDFIEYDSDVFEPDKACVDMDALFIDVNKDSFQDLYVCSGGYHDFKTADPRLQDRLYINDGTGNFFKSGGLPNFFSSSSCVAANDIDQDGFPDLFVGGFVIPGRYPEIPPSFVLMNDGRGNFTIRTREIAPVLENIGMVSDAVWHDLNNDNTSELIIAGHWMPVMVFNISNGKLMDNTAEYFDNKYNGLWNTVLADDLNNDGRIDLVAGNLGLNSQISASMNEPLELYYKDFDNNGSVDPILCMYMQGKSYPYMTLKELTAQVTGMEKRFPTFESYADATIEEIFTGQEMEGIGKLEANQLSTTYFEQTASGKFVEKPLPIEVQYAPVYTIITLDYDDDGNKDLLMSGNINNARIRIGKYDANYGLLLHGRNGTFQSVPQHRSGFTLKGDIRSVLHYRDLLIFGVNQGELRTYLPR